MNGLDARADPMAINMIASIIVIKKKLIHLSRHLASIFSLTIILVSVLDLVLSIQEYGDERFPSICKKCRRKSVRFVHEQISGHTILLRHVAAVLHLMLLN